MYKTRSKMSVLVIITLLLSLVGGMPVFATQPDILSDGLNLWLKADTGVVMDGSHVSQWDDQSGNGINAVQSNEANQPEMVPGVVNGKPVIRFDGVSDYMTFTLPVNGLTGMTVFIVSSNSSDRTGGGSQAENAALFWNETSGWGSLYLSPFQTNVKFRFGSGQSGNQPSFNRPESIGNDFSITAMEKDGSTDSLYINGDQVLSQDGKQPATGACMDIGNIGRGLNDNTYFPGDIAEVIVYNRALDDTERQQIEEYLNGKYLSGSVTPATTATLNGPDSALFGIPYRLTYGLTSAEAVYAQDVTFEYDSNVFDYTGVDVIAQNTVVADVYNDHPGTIRFMIATKGQGNGLTGANVPVLTLNFDAKAETSGSAISLTNGEISDGAAHVKTLAGVSKSVAVAKNDLSALTAAIATARSIYEAAVEGVTDGQYILGAKAVLDAALDAADAVLADSDASQADINNAVDSLDNAVEEFQSFRIRSYTGDVTGSSGNPDGDINIADLGFVACHYGSASDSTDWNIARAADINRDGSVGLFDLTFVARRILLGPSDSGDPTIPHEGMTATATSQEPVAPASSAIDDDSATGWHIRWSDPRDNLPQSITIDLGSTYDIGALRYLPRQDSNYNGMISRHNIYVSIDGVEFTKVVDNEIWEIDQSEKTDYFPRINARYVKLEALEGSNSWACAAEINIERYVETPPVSGIEISPASSSIAGYGTMQLTANVLPEKARNKKVAWTSSDPAVAYVGKDGQVITNNVGTATITATTEEGGFVDTCEITVTPVAVTGFSVTPATLGLRAGEGKQMTALIAPAEATDKLVTWSSTDTNVVTVTAGGYVTAVGAGTAVITGTTRNGGFESSCTLEVTEAGEGVAALKAADFLNSIGAVSSISKRGETLKNTIDAANYMGIKWFRAGFEGDIPNEDFIELNQQTGAKISYGLGSGSSDIQRLLSGARELANAGALLAFEGNNEPNNWSVSPNGIEGGRNLSWLPVAYVQRNLYSAVKNDPVLKNYPVFNIGGESGAQTDNVGLQFLTVPDSAGTLMPAGTQYADYANVHNYFCHPTLGGVIDNMTWYAADPILETVPGNGGNYDGLYLNYGRMWGAGHYLGYSNDDLKTLPRVTTETGIPVGAYDGVVDEEMQGRMFACMYLSQFKQGFSYTSAYLLRDRTDEAGNQQYGFYKPDYTPRKAAVYLHNLTTVLDDDNSIAVPGYLDYSIQDQPDTVHDLLLQKSNGKFCLVVWDERFTGGEDTITVNLGNTYNTVKIYNTTVGTEAVQTLNNVNSVNLTLSDYPFIIEIE